MIDVTLTFNNYDFSPLLSKYRCYHAVEVADSLTAIDGTEYVAMRKRPMIEFSLMPLTDEQAQDVYDALSVITAEATYTDPHRGEAISVMNLKSDLDAVFLLSSIDGNRYYRGGTIVLRSRTVL